MSGISAYWPMHSTAVRIGSGRATAARRSPTGGNPKAVSCSTAGKATTRRSSSTCWALDRRPTRCRQESYAAWTSTYEWKEVYGREFLYGSALFTHQFSHLWIDFRGIQDAFMRRKGIDYFENSRRATYVQQQYAMHNPLEFEGYGRYVWGLTASDGPGATVRKVRGVDRRFFDYAARGVPYGPDDGTVAPWAVAASLPFAPQIVLPTVRHFKEMHPHTPGQVLLQVQLQFDLSERAAGEARLDLAVQLRDQPGADRIDVRELPLGPALATDAALPLPDRGVAAGGVCERLAVRRPNSA